MILILLMNIYRSAQSMAMSANCSKVVLAALMGLVFESRLQYNCTLFCQLANPAGLFELVRTILLGIGSQGALEYALKA